MVGLRIEVRGPGMDCNCIGLFSRYSNLIRNWGYGEDLAELEYVLDENRAEPLVVGIRDGIKSRIWEGIPTPRELRDYLRRELGEHEPVTARASPAPSSFRRPPPW